MSTGSPRRLLSRRNNSHPPEFIIEWDENEDTLDRKNDYF